MGTYIYKSEEAHIRHLEKRRAYYQKNKKHIRERDNATARRNRLEKPDIYKKHKQDFDRRKAKKAAPELSTLNTNPDRHLIALAVVTELKEKGLGESKGA